MASSTIAWRIADFLKRYPPFQFFSEADLLALCEKAKVRFHEEGEIVFAVGENRHPYVFVINKGTVRLLKVDAEGEELIDLRAEGDLLGLGFFVGDKQYLHTARTDSETIIYALPSDPLKQILPRYPDAIRYLAAYFSLNPRYPLSVPPSVPLDNGPLGWLDEKQLLPDWSGRRIGFCHRWETLHQVARTLSFYEASLLAVVDEEMRPVGYLTEDRLCYLLAENRYDPDLPAAAAMLDGVPTAPAGLTVGDYILTLMDSGSSYLCLTEDGTAQTPLLRLVGREDILFSYGTDPVITVQEIIHNNPEDPRRVLKHLRDRAEAQVHAAFQAGADLCWLGRLNWAFNRALLRRVFSAALAKLGIGERPGSVPYCLALIGRAGRQELFGRHGLDWVLIAADDPADAEGRRQFIQRLSGEIQTELNQCGFLTDNGPTSPSPNWALTLTDWKKLWQAWIMDETADDVARYYTFFDLQPVAGDPTLANDLLRYAQSIVEQHPSVLRTAAQGVLSQVPPLTIFRGTVVEEEGVASETLELKKQVLLPTVKVARLLSWARGDFTAASTVERLRSLAAAQPEQRALCEESAAAYLLVLRWQARSVLSGRGAGTVMKVAELPRYDQHLMKSAFRAIEALLEQTAQRFGVSFGSEEAG